MSTAQNPLYRAYAIHYADRDTTMSECYYAWPSYGLPDTALVMSYFFWVLEPLHDPTDGPIVIDTGFSATRSEGREPRITPAGGLALLGIDPGAVRRLVVSHIHYDHVGNLALFPDARITVSRRDYEFWAHDPVAERPQFSHHTDWDGVDLLRRAETDGRIDLVGLQSEIAPGVVALDVGGHSPGQLIFDIAGENGPIALASDAIHFYDELEHERPFQIFSDLAGMYRGYDRLRERAAAGSAVVAGHDPAVMTRFGRLDGAVGEHVVDLAHPRSDR